ncbi:ATP-NAD kinase-like domain-containing protein [Fimicolochytrium jonesii]|uniref:ATP-NAD kinase-like domain-containing protein n=1 Tax=Fimicolochytrium jonesii TaxID=1396493 RepID=UPI0022FE7A52|nr:ATP-NAD kinase-like domain-containing protein [Fimicolochytrium jonesii]KAI8819655.1 ATP-NAD kinase-like domain-containing protein [Fimicolochytrium jonesii]
MGVLAIIIDAFRVVIGIFGRGRSLSASLFSFLSQHCGYYGAITVISSGVAAVVYATIWFAFPKTSSYTPQTTGAWAGGKPGNKRKVPYEHVWVKGDMLLLDHGQGPSYCNACSHLVVQGLACLVCRRCAHEEHYDMVQDMPCKLLYSNTDIPNLLRMKRKDSTSSINSSSSVDDNYKPLHSIGSRYSEHQWVEGNLSVGAQCAVCKSAAGSEPTLKDMRCIWCDVAVHTTCFTQFRQKCPLGPIPHLVVPPLFVTRISNATRGASKKPEPRFKVADLPEGSRPLLCIVNPASGAQNSGALLGALFAMLNPVQIVDTSQENPEALIRAFEPVLDRCRILVCGGDGTIQWALSILDKVIEKAKPKPPVGVLPLGTGNDLARVLGWGGGWTGSDVRGIVRAIDRAAEVEVDRWRVTVAERPNRLTSTEKVGRALHLSTGKPPKVLMMNNYFSVGTDASVALDFHTTRLRQPQFFRNRLLNKVWYAMYGGKHQLKNLMSFMGITKSLSSGSLSVLDDDKSPQRSSTMRSGDRETIDESFASPGTHEPLSSSWMYLDHEKEGVDLTDVGALLVLNIPSYGGGGKIYATAEADGYPPSLLNDAKLEVLTVASPLHLGASVVGLSSPNVVGQAHHIRLAIDAPQVAMQVDGEPWLQQGPATVLLEYAGKTKMLKRGDLLDGEESENEEETLIADRGRGGDLQTGDEADDEAEFGEEYEDEGEGEGDDTAVSQLLTNGLLSQEPGDLRKRIIAPILDDDASPESHIKSSKETVDR